MISIIGTAVKLDHKEVLNPWSAREVCKEDGTKTKWQHLGHMHFVLSIKVKRQYDDYSY